MKTTAVLIGVLVIAAGLGTVIMKVNEGKRTTSEKTAQNPIALKQYQNIDEKEFSRLIKEEGVIIVDVRTEEEYSAGYIKGAKLIPVDKFDKTLDKEPLPKDKKILIYCHSGNRSRTAAASLIVRGYENVYNLQYGILSWEAASLPIEK